MSLFVGCFHRRRHRHNNILREGGWGSGSAENKYEFVCWISELLQRQRELEGGSIIILVGVQ